MNRRVFFGTIQEYSSGKILHLSLREHSESRMHMQNVFIEDYTGNRLKETDLRSKHEEPGLSVLNKQEIKH